MGSGLQVKRDLVTLQVQGAEDVPALAAAVVRAGRKLYSLEPRRNTLEDLFVEIIENHHQNGIAGHPPAELPVGDQVSPGGDSRVRLL